MECMIRAVNAPGSTRGRSHALLTSLFLLCAFGAFIQAAHGQADGFDDHFVTAVGYHALYTIGTTDPPDADGSAINNTAVGAEALYTDAAGAFNTAVGNQALYNDNASSNTAVGNLALFYNSSGAQNTGVGGGALYSNVTGSYNTAAGQNALIQNVEGNYNLGSGATALQRNVFGSYNVAVGYAAGQYTNLGGNIEIGHPGVPGEYAVIRLGNPLMQAFTYVAGISTSPVTGAAVYVTSSGQLGVLASSKRYKTGIASLPASDKLARLRPVTFHLKTAPKGPLQYGLIAEEVDKIYPELVIRNAAGEIQGLRYDELAPLLLRELQHQQRQLAAESDAAAAQTTEIHALEQQLADLKRWGEELRQAKVQPSAREDLLVRR